MSTSLSPPASPTSAATTALYQPQVALPLPPPALPHSTSPSQAPSYPSPPGRTPSRSGACDNTSTSTTIGCGAHTGAPFATSSPAFYPASSSPSSPMLPPSQPLSPPSLPTILRSSSAGSPPPPPCLAPALLAHRGQIGPYGLMWRGSRIWPHRRQSDLTA